MLTGLKYASFASSHLRYYRATIRRLLIDYTFADDSYDLDLYSNPPSRTYGFV